MVLNVELEEKSTGDFSVSGGYSTTDGALAEVSISERNLLGRGLYAKAPSPTASMRAASRCRSSSRICWIIASPPASTCSTASNCPAVSVIWHQDRRILAETGLRLREDLSLQLRYSLYRQKSRCRRSSTIVTTLPLQPHWAAVQSDAFLYQPGPGRHRPHRQHAGRPLPGLLGRWRILTAGSPGTGQWRDIDFIGRLFADLQHARQQQEPDRWSAGRLEAGLCRRRRRRHLSEVRGRRQVLCPVVSDIVGLDPRSGRHPQPCRRSAASHARSVPDGTEPGSWLCPQRHRSARPDILSLTGTGDAIGGTKYWGASLELQMPFWFLPKEVGLKGAVYADAGSLWGYQGPTTWAPPVKSTVWSTAATCKCGMVVR